MSSSHEPRIWNKNGQKQTKEEYVESRYEIGRYDNTELEFLMGYLLFIAEDIQNSQVPQLESWREKYLADGKISTRDSDLVKTVSEKCSAMALAAAKLLVALHVFPEQSTPPIMVRPNTTLSEELKGRAIFLIEKYEKQVATVEWIEHFVVDDADNLTAIIEDASTFPDPPFQE